MGWQMVCTVCVSVCVCVCMCVPEGGGGRGGGGLPTVIVGEGVAPSLLHSSRRQLSSRHIPRLGDGWFQRPVVVDAATLPSCRPSQAYPPQPQKGGGGGHGGERGPVSSGV